MAQGEVIKGFNIELGLDTLGVEEGMKGLNRTMSRVNAEFSRSLSAFDRGERSVARYETTVRGLSSKMEVQEKVVDSNRQSYSALSKQYDDSRSALDKASKGVSEAEKEMARLKNSTGTTKEEFAKAEATLKEAESAFIAVNEEVARNKKELDNAEISLSKAERDYNKLAKSVEYYKDEMKKMYIEQEIANSNWTKAGNSILTFSDNLGKVSSVVTNVGDTMTRKITMPALGVATAVGGIVAAFGWGRLKSIDAAQAQLLGLGYDAQDVERITAGLVDALEDGMMTMGEATSAAAVAMAAGVKEGKELTRYIKILDAAAAGSSGTLDEMSQSFGIITDQGKLTRNEFDKIALRMPGFSSAVQKHFNISSEAMYEMLRNGEITTADFLDIMEGFAGDMATEYAKSWDGMVQNTKAYIGILGQELLGGVFAESKLSIAEFIELLKSDSAKEWARDTGVLLADSFVKVKDAVKDTVGWYQNLDGWQKELIKKSALVAVALGPTLSIVGRLGKGVSVLGKAFGGLFKWIGVQSGTAKGLELFGKSSLIAGENAVVATGAVKGLSGGFKGLFGRVGAVAGSAGIGGLPAVLSALTGPVGIATAAIGTTLAGAFIYAYNESEGFRWAVNETVKSLGDLAKAAMDTEEYLYPLIDEVFKPMASALEGTEEPIYTFTEQMGIVKDVLKIGVDELFRNWTNGLDEMKEEIGSTSDVSYQFGEDVSKSTAEIVTNYIKMSDEVTEVLEGLRYNHRENQDAQIEDLVQSYEKMHEEAIRLLQERHTDEYAEAEEHLNNTFSMSEADKEKTLELIKDHHRNEESELNGKYERVNEIIVEAQSSEEGLTVSHIDAIERILNDHNYQTTQNLSESEIEQEGILQRAKTNKLKISEETVSGLIKDSIEAKKKTVEEAEKKRDETIAWAIDQHKNHGSISEEEMKDIIRDAELTYENSVNAAENKHKDVIGWAKKQATDHGIIVDEETGDILSKWDLFKRNFSTILSNVKSMAFSKALEIGSNIASPIINALNSLSEKFNKIPEALGIKFRLPHIGSGGRYGNATSAGSQYTPLASYSTGTNFHTGGAALLGDKGPGNRTGVGGSSSSTREIVELPNKKKYLVDGNVIWPDFPIGAKVKSNREAEKELEDMGYGSGSDIISAVTGIPQTVKKAASNFGSMIKNIYDYVSNPNKLISGLIGQIGIGGGSASVALGKGMLSSLTDGLISKVKSLFELSSSTGDGSYILKRRLNQGFGRYSGGVNFNDGQHFGIDTAHIFEPLLSPINGVVTRIWNDFGGGNSLQIKSGRDTWWFMHLSKILANVGDTIKAGMRVAITGNSGNWTTGAHLHTQLMRGGIGNRFAVDPIPTLKRLAGFKGSFENGGWINNHGFYEAGEGNKPEVVIPMTNKTRAIELMWEVMSYLNRGNSESRPTRQSTGNDYSALEAKLDKIIDYLDRIAGKDWDVHMNGRSVAKEIYEDVDELIGHKNKRREKYA